MGIVAVAAESTSLVDLVNRASQSLATAITSAEALGPPSLRNVENLLHERDIGICHETDRFWWHRFGRWESPSTSGELSITKGKC